MIVVNNTDGQFCNRILLMAHIAATGMKYGIKTFFPFMGNTLDILDTSSFIKHKYKIFTFRFKHSKLFMKIFNRMLKNDKYYDNRRLCKKGIVFVNTWYCRNYNALFECRKDIIELLKFKEETVQKAKVFFDSSKKDNNNTIIIALHIRRGDYRLYRNGEFFYSDEEYINIMRCLINSTQKHIRFYLFSNEEIQTETFISSGFDVVNVYNQGGEIDFDLALMAMCDYIMGVPSTFSWWAAFYGDKPYLTLKDKNKNYTIEDFAKVEGEEFNSDYTLEELKSNHYA